MSYFKKFLSCVLASSLMLLPGCIQKPVQEAPAPEPSIPEASQTAPEPAETTASAQEGNASFDSLLEQAKGSTVTFYGWGGDEKLNAWLDTVYAPRMKEKYEIELKRVPMDIDQILSKLSGEVQAGKQDGSIDMIWINGENFYSAKENGLLSGPFVDELPNYANNLDPEAEDNLYDFAVPIEGYEAPYGKAQLVLMNDSARTPETPKNAQALLEFAQKYPGQVTYAAPPDFTGSAFVRNIIYELVGYEQFQDMEPDKETVKAAIEPALEYLRTLNPYLWNQGKSFPATNAQVENMFMDGETALFVSYEPYCAATNIEKGLYPETVQSFVFDKGTIGNTNFIAIAQNASNRAGALVAINEMLSAEMQASRYQELKVLPVLDYNRLSDEEKQLFDGVEIGRGSIPQNALLEKRLPEMPAKLVPIIEEIWLDEVVGK